MSEVRPSSDQPVGPIAWMARNSIAANLLMVILLVGGLWFALRIQKEVFPQFQLDVVEVRVTYPGAAPAEVEQGILRPVEEAIRGVDGVREITSEAREGSGSVSIELVTGTDRMKAFQDVDQAVSRIRTFPDDIEEPEVRLRSRQTQVISIGLYGDVDIWTLRRLAEQLRDQLLARGHVTQVELGNVPDYVTHVEIPRNRLREYGLTLPDVARLIESSSEDIAAGAVRTSAGEILLRVKARKQWAEQFERIEIVAGDNGSIVTLGDLATIRDGFEEEGFHSQFNRQPSVELEVYRVGSQSPIDVAAAVTQTLREYEPLLPPGVKWRIDSNNAEDFGRRLTLVIKNGLLAVVIVLMILALFLEFRLAFWVMMGMSISFIGALLVMPVVGVSINMISLFGFLMVLGIVVDDAVVVGENVYEHRQGGEGPLQAAISGAREIAGPVTFTILTNIVAFIPLLFIPGETGKFWKPLPIVVIIVLAVSLLEALFILPAHLRHTQRTTGKTHIGAKLHRGQQAFSRLFSRLVNSWYRPVLRGALRLRYVTTTAALALLWVVGSYALSAHMGIILMPEVSADEIEAGVRLPVGTTPDQAARVAGQLTTASLRMFEEHDLHEVAEGVKTNVRGQNFIDVEIVMKPPDERDMTAGEVIELWRSSIGDLPGVDQITFEAERGPGGYRQDISVDLSHSDIDVLEEAARALVEQAEQFANTRDVNDSYNKGKTQFDFRLLPEGRALGLTPADVGGQLRGAFYGSLALRLLRGTNEIEVRVKLPEAEREDLYHLEDLVIRTPQGAEVPLLDVVEVTQGEAFTSISRRDGRRIVNVSMDVEPKRATGRVITSLQTDVLPQLQRDYPGMTWSFEGSDAEMREATATLWGGFGLALVVIYALLAIAFRRYLQPLIVLVAIPFGIVGAVIGHILLGHDLSLISLMGVIALSGVVVNDSLIMIDFANRNRGDLSAFDAILKAGVRRFRPIFLTTATTFFGLTPVILEKSLQAQYIVPMAISLGFGIVFATSIILLLVPCLYLILEDLVRFTRPGSIGASHPQPIPRAG
ncbi:MAG: efflux RND transporter permease subunit [Planctomycetota bacterium]|nr:efflux RND transporter permease subunit [Planctomycetota bacterium]